MNHERTEAYRRVMHTLAQLGPSKLQSEEQERIRQSADALLFSSNLTTDPEAQAALADAGALCRALVQSGRWEPTTAAALEADLRQCGPAPTPGLQAA